MISRILLVVILAIIPFTANAVDEWVVNTDNLLIYKDVDTFTRSMQLVSLAKTPEGNFDISSAAGWKYINFLKEIAVNGNGLMLPRDTHLEMRKKFQHSVKIGDETVDFEMMELVTEDSETPYYWSLPKGKFNEYFVLKPKRGPFVQKTYEVVKKDTFGYTHLMAYIREFLIGQSPPKVDPLFEAGEKSGAIRWLPVGTRVVVRRTSFTERMRILCLVHIEGKPYWIPEESLEEVYTKIP